MTDLNLPKELDYIYVWYKARKKEADEGNHYSGNFNITALYKILTALSNARNVMDVQTKRAEEAESDLKESLIDASGEIIFYKDQIKKLSEGKICVCRILGKQS